MAHMFESGFFVRQKAWHELGNVLDHVPNTEEAYNVSGLNWNVVRKPLYFDFNGEQRKGQANALIRDTDGSVLGICRERYEILQNSQAFNWCNPLVETDLWTYETAGSLNNGKICWILLKQGEVELVHKDVLKQYVLFNWSHEGTKSVSVIPTTIRVVCNNTLQVALNEKGSVCNKIRHTKNMIPKLDEIRNLYEETTQMFNNQTDAFKYMLDTKVTDGQIEQYIDKLLLDVFSKDINSDSKKAKTIATNSRQFLIDAAYNGSGSEELGIRNTMYGVFNGIQEGIEHFLGGNKIKDRGSYMLFGQGKKATQAAFDLAMTM